MYAMEGYEKAFPREMEVFVSSDGENFKSVGKYSGSSVGKKGADVSFKESDVRYVRVRVTKYGDYSSVNAEGSTVYYYAIGDIEVTGKLTTQRIL